MITPLRLRRRVCLYLHSRRKSDWATLAVLHLLLGQLLVGTVLVYAQDSGVVAEFRRQRDVETKLAVAHEQIEREHDDIIGLKSDLATVALGLRALDARVASIENVKNITGKILTLSYTMIGTIIAGLVVAIINTRLQARRRHEQVSKSDLQALIAAMRDAQL